MLMHDAGGNRQATLDTLPEIIDQLHAKGFRFVTTHELVGKPRNEIMPPLVAQSLVETTAVEAVGASLHTLASLGSTLPAVAIITTILVIFRLTLIIIGATWHKLRRPENAKAAAGQSSSRRLRFWFPRITKKPLSPRRSKHFLAPRFPRS